MDLKEKRTRDLSVQCGYYDELYMDVLDVIVLRSDKHAAFIKNGMEHLSVI